VSIPKCWHTKYYIYMYMCVDNSYNFNIISAYEILQAACTELLLTTKNYCSKHVEDKLIEINYEEKCACCWSFSRMCITMHDS